MIAERLYASPICILFQAAGTRFGFCALCPADGLALTRKEPSVGSGASDSFFLSSELKRACFHLSSAPCAGIIEKRKERARMKTIDELTIVDDFYHLHLHL